MSQDGGGQKREFGWSFYNPALLPSDWRSTSLPKYCTIGKGVRLLRVYGTQLTTSELIANYRASVDEIGPS